MSIPSFVIRAGQVALGLAGAVGSVALFSAPKSPFTRHEKAYYLSEAQTSFIRPGLVFTVKSVNIATDGTVKVDFLVADPKGATLDRTGVVTAGAISSSFVLAYIPQGQEQFVSYITRTEKDPDAAASTIQATGDSGGTYSQVGDGEYVYTFGNKLPAGFDQTATHRLGIYGNRNLTEFSLGTQYASTVFDFVPNGSKVTSTRDVVRTSSCNKCHDQLAFHGGSRRGVELCVMCHTPQTTDSGTGNTVDFKVFIHKLHRGKNLPSVIAGKTYGIEGFGNTLTDYSAVNFPAYPGPPASLDGSMNCQSCHDPKSGAAQADAWATKPTAAACGSCHDNVNFASGVNHAGGPQADDKLCSQCHVPSTGGEFDASIMGAHTIPARAAQVAGLVATIVKVANGSAGKQPTVTFTLRDNAGNGVPLSDTNHLALVMAGPTTDYGYTSFGPDVTTPGYVSEDPTKAAACSNDGTCTYTFTHAIPADAKGTYSIGMEARKVFTLNPGTTLQTTQQVGAINPVYNFSVDGTPVTPRRTVVSLSTCNTCHAGLSMHGENRNQIEMCVLCHNPSENDASQRTGALKGTTPQAVDFALMIHNIHTGTGMQDQNRTYVVIGFGGSVNDFSGTPGTNSIWGNFANGKYFEFPSMSPSGGVGNVQACHMCHVNNSNQLPLQPGLNQVSQPQGPITTMGPITAACTGCHGEPAALSHVVANTTAQFGESCEVCHGSDAEFDVNKVHAQ